MREKRVREMWAKETYTWERYETKMKRERTRDVRDLRKLEREIWECGERDMRVQKRERKNGDG
jgi:SPX domain protein involved in polyphosphate accumulation